MNWLSPRSLLATACIAVCLLVGGLSASAYLVLGREADARAVNEAYARLEEFDGEDVEVARARALAMLRDFEAGANSSAVLAVVPPGSTGPVYVTPRPAGGRAPATLHFDVAGERAYGFWIPIGRGQWFFVGERVAPYFASVHRVVIAIILSGLLAAVALAIIGFVAQRRLRSQLNHITDACRQIGAGALNLRLDERIASKELVEVTHHVNAMVERLDVMVGNLRTVSLTIAHDMRNYILHARMQLQRLQWAETVDPDGRIKRALAAIQLLDTISVEIARLSLQRSQVNGNAQVHDLAKVALQAAELFEDSCQDLAVELKVDAQSACASVNPVLVLEIVNNLLSNAVRYGSSGHTIELACIARENTAVLLVSDSGPGIPEDQRDRIFRLEQRLARDESVEGYGYGLAIAKLLTDINGGSIEVTDTHPGAKRPGARFIITFPLANAPG